MAIVVVIAKRILYGHIVIINNVVVEIQEGLQDPAAEDQEPEEQVRVPQDRQDGLQPG